MALTAELGAQSSETVDNLERVVIPVTLKDERGQVVHQQDVYARVNLEGSDPEASAVAIVVAQVRDLVAKYESREVRLPTLTRVRDAAAAELARLAAAEEVTPR